MPSDTLARTCEVCGRASVRHLRHSDVYDFDIGRCRACSVAYVLDPPPAVEVETAYEGGSTPDEYVDWQRGDDELRVGVLERLRELTGAGPDRRPLLFDVGAGVGDFIMLAREHGFEVTGNEIAQRAIDFTRERHGIELSDRTMGELEPASVDVITMWCIIAHVVDPRAFLQEALGLLRPGGVLFLRTPRWCAIDTVGFGLDRLTGGRVHQVADRRITPAHLHLFGERNLGRLISSVGFSEVAVEPTCHYPLTTDVYLWSTGVPRSLSSRAGRLVDGFIERDWFVRNTLLAYARRPAG